MKKNKLPSLITILVLTLITVLMWVGFSIYQAFSKPAISSVPDSISSTISPILDSNTIKKIESSIFFDESQIATIDKPVSQSPTPTGLPITLPTPTQIASPSASPSALPTFTPSPTP